MPEQNLNDGAKVTTAQQLSRGLGVETPWRPYRSGIENNETALATYLQGWKEAMRFQEVRWCVKLGAGATSYTLVLQRLVAVTRKDSNGEVVSDWDFGMVEEERITGLTADHFHDQYGGDVVGAYITDITGTVTPGSGFKIAVRGLNKQV